MECHHQKIAHNARKATKGSFPDYNDIAFSRESTMVTRERR
jgi:hypothetical protein